MAFSDQAYKKYDGMAELLGDDVIVEDSWSLSSNTNTVIHEMGHIFGAIDYKSGHRNYNAPSVMTYNSSKRTDSFDKENAERVMENKYRSF